MWFGDIAEALPRAPHGRAEVTTASLPDDVLLARRGHAGTAELAPAARPELSSLLGKAATDSAGKRAAVETIIESGRSILALTAAR